MPPKADYWQYFVVQGVLATCQLPGCSNPNVSLGALPKAGEKKRISEYIFYTITAHYHWCFHSATGGVSNHLSKHHKEVWEAYSETRSRVATVATKAKEEEKAAFEMENSEVRFYDVRSRKGRLPFLKKVNCCEMHFSLICIVLFRFCLMSQNLQRTGWTVTPELRLPTWGLSAKWWK